MTSFERLLRDIVPPLMRRWQVPGVAVGLSYRGQRTLCGFGVRPGGGTPVGEAAVGADTVFGIGSVADTFLAALVARLAEQGRLGLDDPAAGLLPGHGLDPRITVRHLLIHSSGLPGDLPGRGRGGLAAALRWLGRAPLSFAPGTEYSRSPAGLVVAAAIVAAVRERPYPDVLASDLLGPAGMTSTRPDACGRLASSVRDLVGYGELMLAGDVPGVVLAPQLSRGTGREHVGLAWNLDQAGDGVVAWQCGRGGSDGAAEVGGDQARMTVVPSRRLAFAILTSGAHGEVVHRQLSEELLWTVTGGTGHDLPRRYEADLGDLVGVFDAGAGGLVTLRPGVLPGELALDVGIYRAARSGWEPVPADRVVPFSAHELLVLGPAAVHGTFIGLVRGDGGRVTGLRIAGRLAPRVGLVPVS